MSYPKNKYQKENHWNYKRIPWNKDKKGLQVAWNKGKHPSLETRIKLSENNGKFWLGKKRPDISEIFKGNKFCLGRNLSEEQKKKIREAIGNEKHPQWKGNKVGYRALHSWLYRHFGRPKQCEFCGRDNLKGREIHWANKTGQYKRDRNNWLRICINCHRQFDSNKNLCPSF